MAVLGSLNGVGALKIGEKRIDDVPYSLTITTQPGRGIKRGDGRLTFKSPREAIGVAMEKARATLELESGATVEIVLTRTTIGDHADATFATSGAIPGF